MIPAAFIRSLKTDPLKLGDPDGMRVRRWRARLRRKGFVVAAEGAFDAKLLHATKVAQTWAGVPADGLVGPVTWAKVGAKTRTRRPIVVIRNTVGKRPKIIDARTAASGFPRHPSRRWEKRSRGAIVAVLGHYTGGPASFLADARFHVTSSYLTVGGAPAIAYAIGVDRDGTVFVFNDFDDVTWHCDGGKNTVTLGIVGRAGSEGFSAVQEKSLKWVVDSLVAGTFGYGYPAMPSLMTTHRHVKATSCPGERGEVTYRRIAHRFTTRL